MFPGFNVSLARLLDAPAEFTLSSAHEALEEAATLYYSFWAMGREAVAAVEDVRDGLVEGAFGVTGGITQYANDHVDAHRAAAERALDFSPFDFLIAPAQWSQDAARAGFEHSRAMSALAFSMGERLSEPFVHATVGVGADDAEEPEREDR